MKKYLLITLLIVVVGCRETDSHSPADTDITQACWWSANYLITHPECDKCYPSAWHVDYINYLVKNKYRMRFGGEMPNRAFWDSVEVSYGNYGYYSGHDNKWIIDYWQSVLQEGFVREINMDTNDTIFIKKDTFYFINKNHSK